MGVFLPEVSPELRARFDQMDALFEHDPDEILAIVPYIDAVGVARICRPQMRAVPDLD